MQNHNFEGVKLFVDTAIKECELDQMDGFQSSILDLNSRYKNILIKMKTPPINNDGEINLFVCYALINCIKSFFDGTIKQQLSKSGILYMLNKCSSFMKVPYEFSNKNVLNSIISTAINKSKLEQPFI